MRIGVSKQAARKRFLPTEVPAGKGALKEQFFSRYGPPARQVIVHAQDTARDHGYGYVDTEHLLLAVLRQRDSLAVQAIAATIDAAALEQDVSARLHAPDESVLEKLPFTSKATKALKLALRKAFQLGHDQVGPEHLLLGLHNEQSGLAAQVLATHNLDPEHVEAEIVRLKTHTRASA